MSPPVPRCSGGAGTAAVAPPTRAPRPTSTVRTSLRRAAQLRSVSQRPGYAVGKGGEGAGHVGAGRVESHDPVIRKFCLIGRVPESVKGDTRHRRQAHTRITRSHTLWLALTLRQRSRFSSGSSNIFVSLMATRSPSACTRAPLPEAQLPRRGPCMPTGRAPTWYRC